MKMRYAMTAAVAAMAIHAGSAATLIVPERIYATPGLECNVYFGQITDALKPENFVYEAKAKVGKAMTRRWAWTPAAADAGKEYPLVIGMWSEEGVVSCATTTVCVAKNAADKSRKVTVAILGDSLANCRYPDALFAVMTNAGWTAYTPVGTRSGDAAQYKCKPGEAPHDCIGGYSYYWMMTRYYLMMKEVDNIQAKAERDQLRHLGLSVPPKKEDYVRALSRSPLLTHRGGKVVADPQTWFDAMNGGKAPDYIFVNLGVNRIFDGHIAEEMGYAREMFSLLRKAAPKTKIVVTFPSTGCSDQDSFAMNYGASFSAFRVRRNILQYDIEITKLVKSLKDPLFALVPIGTNVDPHYSYIYSPAPYSARSVQSKAPWNKQGWTAMNALHPNLVGGMQVADALGAWLMWDLGK